MVCIFTQLQDTRISILIPISRSEIHMCSQIARSLPDRLFTFAFCSLLLDSIQRRLSFFEAILHHVQYVIQRPQHACCAHIYMY